MRSTTIRMSAATLELIAEEAQREGITTSQFIREAAIARAAYLQGQRAGEPGRTMAAIIERLRRSS